VNRLRLFDGNGLGIVRVFGRVIVSGHNCIQGNIVIANRF
jgi:hypothetical protein